MLVQNFQVHIRNVLGILAPPCPLYQSTNPDGPDGLRAETTWLPFKKYSHPRTFFHCFERERNIDVREKHRLVASCRLLTQDWTHNLGMCPDQKSSLQPFGVWDDGPASWAAQARGTTWLFISWLHPLHRALNTYYSGPGAAPDTSLHTQFYSILSTTL